MKRTIIRDAFFCFAVLAFACLLLSGGSRLIAFPEENTRGIQLSEGWIEASITCPPPQERPTGQHLQQTEKKTPAGEADFARSEPESPVSLITDANGNILGRRCYMRTVYQVFALGDGFV